MDDERANNVVGPGRLRARVALPFFWRRIRASFRSRSGAASTVLFDAAAFTRNPSVTWIGHATLLVHMDGATFLTDPMYSRRASPFLFAGPMRLVPPGVPLEALPRLDFALLSHDHYDHTDPPTIRRLAALNVPFIAPKGLGEVVREVGGRVLAELGWWEHIDVAGVRVICTPARHFAGRGFRDRNRRLWSGFVVTGRTRRFYHAGDTAFFPGFTEIGERLGPIDLAALPIGAYQPSAMMGPVHMDPEEAVRAARQGLADRAFVMSVGETRGF